MKEMAQLLKQQSVPPPPPPAPAPASAPVATPQYAEPEYEPTPPPPPPSNMPKATQYQETPVYPKRNANQAPDVNEIVNTMTGSYVPSEETDVNDNYDEVDDSDYFEPKPEVKIISQGKKPKRGRPKK